MRDYSELKQLAEAARAALDEYNNDECNNLLALAFTAADDKFHDATEPDVVLALIAENERLSEEVDLDNKIIAERDRLLNLFECPVHGQCVPYAMEQVEVLRRALAECAESLHGEMLQKFVGQLPAEMHPVTRREYDRDVAELSGYLAALGKGEQS